MNTTINRAARLLATFIAGAAAALLAACSTPQAALDQANATAGLVTRFDGELAAYRKAAARVAQARLEAIRRQEALIAQLSEVDAWNLRTARLAGLSDAEERRRLLVDLAESREADEAATRQRLAELDAQLASLVAPLPSSAAKLAALKRALADLGTELPADERLKLALDAVSTVRDEVRKNRDAAQAALGAASKAPVPATPSTPSP